LDEERVKAIRERLKQQGVTLKVVAQEFGISVTQVYRIKANQNWRISS
jgi:DNA invertase Pin-like site-specific DNA recombinase